MRHSMEEYGQSDCVHRTMAGSVATLALTWANEHIWIPGPEHMRCRRPVFSDGSGEGSH